MPHAPDTLRFLHSIPSLRLPHLLPLHYSLSFLSLLKHHLLLYHPPFIHSLSGSLYVCCSNRDAWSLFSDLLVTANALLALVIFPFASLVPFSPAQTDSVALLWNSEQIKLIGFVLLLIYVLVGIDIDKLMDGRGTNKIWKDKEGNNLNMIYQSLHKDL